MRSYTSYEEFKLLLDENNKLKQKLSTSNNFKLDLIQQDLNFNDNKFYSITNEHSSSTNEKYENYLRTIQEKCDIILKEFEMKHEKLKYKIGEKHLTGFGHLQNSASLIEKIEEIGKITNMLTEFISKSYIQDQDFDDNISNLYSNESQNNGISHKIMYVYPFLLNCINLS